MTRPLRRIRAGLRKPEPSSWFKRIGAHLLDAGHALGIGYAEHDRARAEVLVESITYIVCGSIGLDTSGESVPYVAGWDDDDLDSLESFARLVDNCARKIEDVVIPSESDVGS